MGAIDNLSRLREITAVVMRHGLGHYLAQRKSKTRTGGLDTFAETAKRFRDLLEELGPTFIKFGQILSTRADLLPHGFAQALQGLQDDCPEMPEADVTRVLEDTLHEPIGKLFKEFNRIPIASASIAQVHRAVLHSGEEVAVKVQRLNIREVILNDLDILRLLARLAEAIIAESGLLTPRSLVEELEVALLQELDFSHEAEMLRRFAPEFERMFVPLVEARAAELGARDLEELHKLGYDAGE